MELRFREQANLMDRDRKEMNVLVYKKENDDIICPHCNKKIKIEKIDDIILSNNNIIDIINGIKLNIDNIIKLSNDKEGIYIGEMKNNIKDGKGIFLF